VGDGGLSSTTSTLRAFDPSGNQKWSLVLGSGPAEFNGNLIGMTPVIGDDGSINIASQTTYFSVSPAGVQNWTWQAFGIIAANPAPGPYLVGDPAVALSGNIVEPAFAVQFGFEDLSSSGAYLAYGYNGSMFNSAAAIAGDGMIYLTGARDGVYTTSNISPGIIEAWSPSVGAQGPLRSWGVFAFSSAYCPPAIGLDGTIYFGGYGISAIH
jgi:hypothetical protein